MTNNYVVYHLHDDTSNLNGYADSCTKYTEYVKLAKKNNMSAIAFSNHGGIYDWIKKKQECDKAGIKYIHGIEAYLCKNFSDNDRGSHIGLYAKNWDGVLELNKLISNSDIKGSKEDNSDRHFYFNPRISLEELMNTSDNIIITTACLASPLNKWNTCEKQEDLNKLINWLKNNKHRCFLEVQYHNAENQIQFNKWIYELSLKLKIPLIAGTDTHSSSKYKSECRKILQKSKDSFYGEEDEFDLIWKSYDELVQCFKIQNSIPEEAYLEAINNTNVLAEMIQDFTLDKSFKYPTLYGDSIREQWLSHINNCYNLKKKNNVLDLINHTEKEYKKQICEEFKIMTKLGMESFMMFMSELLGWCKNNNIPYGTGRGSVCGSVIAYITDITDVDPIVWETVFSRFCNEDRVSLGDIDVDFAPEDREKVYKYIIERFTPEKTAYIASFSTLKTRGCIDVLAKGLDYHDLDKVAQIKDEYDEYLDKYSKLIQEEVGLEDLVENGELDTTAVNFDYHDVYISRIKNETALHKCERIKKDCDNLINANTDLFYYLDGLKNTIIAKGSHPSGIIGSPIMLEDNVGLFHRNGDINQPISTCAMKSIDSLNYVKFDILGLKTVGIIKDICNYIKKDYPKSHEVNWNDENVWNNMIQAKQGVFQFEGDYAHDLLKNFKPRTINHMSMVNAALRPSGKSYRDRLIAGEFNNNPSEEIDELLKDNNGYLIFQEDTIKFLTDICDFTGSAADTTRRCLDENTLIMTANGNYKKIKDISIGDTVQSFNQFNISEFKEVENKYDNGEKDVYEISTQHNNQLIATDNHKLLTQRGWIEVKNLTTSDFIMTPKNINSKTDNLTPQQRLKETDMFLIGMLIGDGCLGEDQKIHFTNHEIILIDKFKECVSRRLRSSINCEFTCAVQDGVDVDKIYSIYIKSKKYQDSLNNLLRQLDLKHIAANKKIPDCIMSYPKGSKLINLLAGLFNTDGGYNYQQSYIEYYSTSEILVKQIKSLLLKYEIYSYYDKKFVSDYNYYCYHLYIRQIDCLKRFKNIILPYMIGQKQNEFNTIINNALNKDLKFNYLLPNECKNEILEMSIKTNKSLLSIGKEMDTNNKYGLSVHYSEFGISDLKAKEIVKNLYCPYTYKLLFADYLPVRVKEIKYVGKSHVYDIEVKDNHNYVANNLIVHNCIGKKDVEGLKQQLPKILEGYCKHSSQPREIAENEARQFIQIVQDSSEYQFGYNHSTAYSMNGYECTMLRTYYPLQFITAYLNRAENKEDINNGVDLAKIYNIKIQPIKYGKSIGDYTYDTESNYIYKGISSIKYCNQSIAEELYQLSQDFKADNFIELLTQIKHQTSINSRQLKILITLNFFSDFGRNGKLLKISELHDNLIARKQVKKSDIEKLNIDIEMFSKYIGSETEKMYKDLDMIGYINESIAKFENKSLSIKEQVSAELEYLEYIDYINPKSPDNFYYVMKYQTYKDKCKPYITLYNLKTGEMLKTKVTVAKDFLLNPFTLGNVLNVLEFKQKEKMKMINGSWEKTGEFEKVLKSWEVY